MVKKRIGELVTNTISEGYTLERVILTSFSLDMTTLKEILYELGALKLVAEGKVHVFFDASNRSGKGMERAILSERYLHGITRINPQNGQESLYAFHPKVMILRYERAEKPVRYVVVVMSKNISGADLLDSYAVAYGDVEETQGCKNGSGLRKFISEELLKDVQDSGFFAKICGELDKVVFHQGDKTDTIVFCDAGQAKKEIEKAKEDHNSKLIVVSPFLSDAFLKEKLENIKIIASSEEGFVSIRDKSNIEHILNNKKGYVFAGDTVKLHAKLYCWKQEGKTRILIGSSNATGNGFGANTEYNMLLTEEVGLYDEIKSEIEDKFVKLTRREYDFAKIDTQDFYARQYFHAFCKGVGITCSLEENGYTCKICARADYLKALEAQKGQVLVQVGSPYRDEMLDVKSETVICEKKPFPVLVVHIINQKAGEDEENSREFSFCLSIYDRWGEEGCKIIDEACDDAYVELLKHIQEQLSRGKSKKSVSLTPLYHFEEERAVQAYHMKKAYVYEKLLELVQNAKSKDEIKASLNEILQLAESILQVRIDDREQKEYMELISQLLKNW